MNTPDESATESLLAARAWPLAKQFKFMGAVMIAAAAIVVGLSLATKHGTVASEQTTLQQSGSRTGVHLSGAQLATITVTTIAPANFRSEQLTDGKIALNGDTTTPVYSPYSGRVTKVIAGVGEYVKQGAPLFAIEATEFAQAQSDLLGAVAQLKLARNSEERRHAAFEAKGGSLQEWQQAQADLAAAQASEAAVRNRLRIFGKTDAEIDEIERLSKPLPVTYVPAPISGVVTDRQIGPGQYLQAGQTTTVYTVGDLSTLWLVANVREADAPAIERGQSVEVRVLAFPGQVFRAKLVSIGASVDPITRRVPVRAVIENANGKLKPEMYASFSIVTSDESTAPAVPEEAVVYEGDGTTVWVLDDQDDVNLRSIKLGRANAGMVEVLDGLKPGEKVVTHGSLFIDRAARPG